jgi:uncharacterized protein (TIGR03086 family)
MRMAPDTLTASLDVLRKVADGVSPSQLGNATPCTHWCVAQVLMHAAGDQHAWAATIGSAAMPEYNPFDPPTDAMGGVASAVRDAVDVAMRTWATVDHAVAALPTPLPPVPELEPMLASAAAGLDAAIHARDVAVATGQPSPLSVELALALRPAADATVEPLRGFAYAAPLPARVDDGAPDALLRFLGRDPKWTPSR